MQKLQMVKQWKNIGKKLGRTMDQHGSFFLSGLNMNMRSEWLVRSN